jgi:hypothetical protein
VPFEKSSWGTAEEVHQKKISKAANGETASSYTADGHWNLGGWWTYPSREAKAASKLSGPRTAPGPRTEAQW